MDITNANLDLLFRAANNRYQAAVSKTNTVYQQIATTFPSATRQEIYAWFDRIPKMRKWFGPRQINNVITHAQTVTNQPYEDTIALSRRDVADDMLGMFNQSVDTLAQQATLWPDRELADFIKTMAVATGYDGVPFYSASHPNNGGDTSGGPSGVQSNLLVSTALSYDNYVSARSKMMSFTGYDGSPLGVIPDALMVPPQLEGVGKLILESDFAANINGVSGAPQTNVYKGTAKLIVNPYLADNGAPRIFRTDC